MYAFVVYMMVRAIILRHILWPQKGEDKDESGFEIKGTRPGALGKDTTPRVGGCLYFVRDDAQNLRLLLGFYTVLDFAYNHRKHRENRLPK